MANRLHLTTLSQLMMIKLNGPDLDSFDAQPFPYGGRLVQGPVGLPVSHMDLEPSLSQRPTVLILKVKSGVCVCVCVWSTKCDKKV